MNSQPSDHQYRPPITQPPIPSTANGLITHLQPFTSSLVAQSHRTYLSNMEFLKRAAEQRNSRKAEEENKKISQKQAQSTKKTKKRLNIGTGRGNFPTIYEAYKIDRQKKIKKKTKKGNTKLIKRFDIDLINISNKIEEELTKRFRNKYIRPTNTQRAYRRHQEKAKKLSNLRKKIETIKLLSANKADHGSEGAQPEAELPYPITDEERKSLVEKQSQLTFRLKKIFNNSPEVKQGYDRNFEVREYIENTLTKEFDYGVLKFLNHLNFSQLLKKRIEPMKYKKRLVYGFNEVTKSLEMTRKEM
jgi:hypothetical protein